MLFRSTESMVHMKRGQRIAMPGRSRDQRMQQHDRIDAAGKPDHDALSPQIKSSQETLDGGADPGVTFPSLP